MARVTRPPLCTLTRRSFDRGGRLQDVIQRCYLRAAIACCEGAESIVNFLRPIILNRGRVKGGTSANVPSKSV